MWVDIRNNIEGENTSSLYEKEFFNNIDHIFDKHFFKLLNILKFDNLKFADRIEIKKK